MQSLLAQLRAAQDDPIPLTSDPSTGTGTQTNTTINGNGKRPRPDTHSGSYAPGPAIADGQGQGTTASAPSSRQLSDLLSSLNQPKSKTLIEPFGPISHLSQAPAPSAPAHGSATKPTTSVPAVGGDGDNSTMSFTKALPIISQLLSDPSLKNELKRMKEDQDSLERRLWAKGERVKVEHEKTTRTDKEMYALLHSSTTFIFCEVSRADRVEQRSLATQFHPLRNE